MLLTQPPTAASPLDATRFERLLSALSARFIDLTIASLDADFTASLRDIVETFGVDRSSLSHFVNESGHLRTRHSWAVDGVAPVPSTNSTRAFPWVRSMTKAGRAIVFDRIDDLPAEAHIDQQGFRHVGLRAHIAQPIVVAGELVGILGLGCVRAERAWSQDDVQRSRLVAEMFANVLARLRRQREVDIAAGFERVATRILASLLIVGPDAEGEAIDKGLADIGQVLDADRVVMWDHSGAPPGFHDRHRWTATTAQDSPESLELALAPWLTAQLAAGRTIRFSREAELPAQAAADLPLLRSFQVSSMLAVPFSSQGAVVGVLSITSVQEDREWPDRVVAGVRLLGEVFASLHARRHAERRRSAAEAQAEQDRAALAHMTRVSMLGQLSASIAHQLNQPLAAILSNAEAARMMLAEDTIDRAELRDICDEIITEDHRAAEIIRRLGALYRRGEVKRARFDLNGLVRETLALAAAELVARQIVLTTELDNALSTIEGGQVQLQQVLLNLVLNAADAMGALPPVQRELTIRTELAPGEARLWVLDRGPGIAAGDRNDIFEAFWSTKPGGMGIGLALCKAIMAAHGGDLTVVNRAQGGAAFCATLPLQSAA